MLHSKPFLIAWLWGYCTFLDNSVVSLNWSPRLGPNHQVRNYFPPKKSCSAIKLFSSSNMFFIRLFLANTWKKKIGVTVLVSSKNVVKGGVDMDMVLRWHRMENFRGGDWDEIQNSAYRVSMHSRCLFSVVFIVWYRQHRNSYLERVQQTPRNEVWWDFGVMNLYFGLVWNAGVLS